MTDFTAVRDEAIARAGETGGPAAATFTRAFLHTAPPEDIAAFPPATRHVRRRG